MNTTINEIYPQKNDKGKPSNSPNGSAFDDKFQQGERHNEKVSATRARIQRGLSIKVTENEQKRRRRIQVEKKTQIVSPFHWF